MNGKVLLLKRAPDSKSRPNKWDLAGGNSEWPTGVTEIARDLHRQDVAREIVEETGLVVAPEYFDFKKLTYFSTFFQPDKQVYSVICGWLAELPGKNQSDSQNNNLADNQATAVKWPEVKISEEHTEFAWASREEVASYDFGVEFVPEIIQAAFQKIA